jgi:hypothetical protein
MPCTSISKKCRFGGFAFIFQAAKALREVRSHIPIYVAFSYYSSGIFIAAAVLELQILQMYDLFEVAVKASINAFLFNQYITNAIHERGISF